MILEIVQSPTKGFMLKGICSDWEENPHGTPQNLVLYTERPDGTWYKFVLDYNSDQWGRILNELNSLSNDGVELHKAFEIIAL